MECDGALTRAGLLVYLPNRGAFYEYDLHRAKRLDLTGEHPIIAKRNATRLAQASAQQEAYARRRKRSVERAMNGRDDESPVDAYNAGHNLGDTLLHYGWTQLRHSRDYRSPFQTSKSYAMRIMGDGPDAMWVSPSASGAAEGIGIATRSGATAGDAFDLYCHFEHGGIFTEAVQAYGAELRQEAGPFGGDSWMDFNDTNTHGIEDDGSDAGTEGNGPHRTAPDWPEPDPRYLSDHIPPPPALPLSDVLGPGAADWVAQTAEAIAVVWDAAQALALLLRAERDGER